MTNDIIKFKLADTEYDVLKVPAAETPVVIAAKKRVMETLVLDHMVTDLGHIHHLLYVAYVGVRESGDLSKQVSNIQFKYIELCTDSAHAMKTMNHATKPILQRLHFFSKFLFEGRETIAFNFLHACQEQARLMASAAMDLSTRFNELAEEANTTQGDATVEQGHERDEAKKIQKRLDKIAEDQKSGEKKRDLLRDEISEAKQRYKAALEHEHDVETRAFYGHLAGMAMNMIGSCVGSAASAYGMSKNPMAAMGGMQGMNPQGTQNFQLQPLQQSAQQFQSQPLQSGMQQNQFAPPPGGGMPAGQNAPSLDPGFSSMGPIDLDNSNSLAALPGGLQGAPAAAYQVMDQYQFQQAHALAMSANAAAAKPNPHPSQAAAAQTANSARSESSKQLDIQMSLQTQQRDLLGTLASLGEELKHKTTDKDYMAHAILAMNAAIGALKQVAGALETAGKNWHSFADELSHLASGEMETTLKAATNGLGVKGMSKADLMEVKKEVYDDDLTKSAILMNFASWQAIHLVAGEYSDAMDKAHLDARTSYEKNPSIDESRSLAEKLGAELAENAKQGILAIESQIDKTKKLKAVVDAGAS